ncbi:hypothetical protein [Mycolicibacterium llatzerense]|uniref:hypothetical protein n=1 Tax=Mycolicibacterium llatzerense TaxID=280871 RepID=UPI0008DCB600|nr:hypothetical protein [Mycolicibacterium llatzerense]
MTLPDDHTVTPGTESGADQAPWQQDPATQLPDVIAPGTVHLRLWSTPSWGDEPLEYEVSLNWDGSDTVAWRVISGVGLSVMSDVYFCGVAGWPDGENVLLNYTRDSSEMGVEQLDAAAPTNGDPDGATDPRRWIELANSLVDLTEKLLDSGGEPFDGFDEDGCYDPVRDEWLDFNDLFRAYLRSSNADSALPSFDDWFEAALAAGKYKLDVPSS